MDDSQTDKVGAWRKMCEFCTADENITDLATVPQIATTAAKLNQNVDDIETADTSATANTTGATDTKDVDRSALEQLCSQFSRSLTVYSFEQNDRLMRSKVEHPNTFFSGLRADKLLQTAKMLAKLATPLMASLLGVTATDLTNFGTAITDFEDVMPLPEALTGEKKAYGEEVDRLFVTAHETEDALRLYMGLLEFTKPLVFARWIAVAHTDDTGSRSSGTGTSSSNVDANGNKVATTVNYITTTRVTLKTTGSTVLEFTLTTATTPTGAAIAVPPGGTVETTLGEMGTGGDAITVHNTSPTVAGAYSVTLVLQ